MEPQIFVGFGAELVRKSIRNASLERRPKNFLLGFMFFMPVGADRCIMMYSMGLCRKINKRSVPKSSANPNSIVSADITILLLR